MKLDPQMSDKAFLELVGGRLSALRVALNLTQGELAEQTGLGLRTVQRLEQGEAAMQLSGFVRVCRALGILDRFEMLIPEQKSSPMDQLKLQGQKRQRATGRKTAPVEKKTWTWSERA